MAEKVIGKYLSAKSENGCTIIGTRYNTIIGIRKMFKNT